MARMQLTKTTSEKLKNASKTLGFDETEIMERAVLLYIDTIQKQINLKQELNIWDDLSDEALNKFEKSL